MTDLSTSVIVFVCITFPNDYGQLTDTLTLHQHFRDNTGRMVNQQPGRLYYVKHRPFCCLELDSSLAIHHQVISGGM